jgi:hypothetical protein
VGIFAKRLILSFGMPAAKFFTNVMKEELIIWLHDNINLGWCGVLLGFRE